MYNKKALCLIAISFFISITIAFQFVDNLDKYESDGLDHHIIKGDISDIWEKGEKFRVDLLSGKNFLTSGTEIYRSYLPPRLIGLFSIIFDYKLISDDDGVNKISLGFKKYFYLVLQSLLFYFILIYFNKKLSKNTNNNEISFYVILFLCFCPDIFLYNSSFHTESIFFSLQVLLLALLISPSQKIIYNFCIGIILLLMFLQKTVAVFYIIIVTLYLVFYYKNKSIKNISIIFLTYISLLVVIGFSNYKRVGIFYFMPIQGNEAVYHYLAHPILTKGQKMTSVEASQKLITDLKKWKVENKIQNEQLEVNRIKIMKFKKKYTIKLIQENFVTTIRIISWKSLQTGILNPIYIFHYHLNEQDINKRPPYYLEKNYLKFWIPIRIIYSSFIYLIILIGFINSIKYFNIKYNLLILASALYMFVMLGWVGNSRYFSPSLVYLSVYFGCGIKYLSNLNFTKIFKLSKND